MAGVALIAGLLIVPLVLLLIGHRFRSRSPRRQRIFWGAAIGYLAGVAIASTAMMLPPVLWSSSTTLRGLTVFGAMPAGFLLGLAVALLQRGGDR